MISEQNRIKPRVVSRPLAFFKIMKGFVQPLLILFILVTGILCFMKPAEGSSSQLIARILFLLGVGLLTVLNFINYQIGRKNESYRTYMPAILQSSQPGVALPLILASAAVLLPLYILIINSIKIPAEANYMYFTWFPQQGVTLEGYEELFKYGDLVGISIWGALWNSVLYALPASTFGLFVAAASAFLFAKQKFRGKKFMWSIMIMTTLMPGCVTLSTAYLMYDVIGWTDSALPLVVPGLFGGVGLVMYLRGFFSAISNSLLEAAEIDGAGKIRQFFTIMLPLAKPALMAQFILTFISGFNDFMGPLIYLNDPSKYSIQIALTFFNNSPLGNSVIAASCVCAMLPMLILYICAQKQVLSSVAVSAGVKG